VQRAVVAIVDSLIDRSASAAIARSSMRSR
jgi:hypothetical protein